MSKLQTQLVVRYDGDMQDPIQPTSPVDPQAVALTDQSMPPSQVVADSTQTVINPTPAVDSQPDNPQPTVPPASDPMQIVSSPTQPIDSQAPPDQNPLDVLESILAEAKQKAGQKAPAGEGSGMGQVDSPPAVTTDPATPPVPPPPTPEEIAAKEAAHQAEIEQQKQQLMAQITQTPEYQAKVQQDAEKAEEESQSSAGGDGFQIQQLQHTKI